jgi:hypothetical protein
LYSLLFLLVGVKVLVVQQISIFPSCHFVSIGTARLSWEKKASELILWEHASTNFHVPKGTSPRAEPMTPDASSRIPADGHNGRGEDLLIVVYSISCSSGCVPR